MRDFEVDEIGRFIRPAEVDDCSEEWRHACEVAHLLRMPEYIFREHLQQIKAKRGDKAYELLLSDCRRWQRMRRKLKYA